MRPQVLVLGPIEREIFVRLEEDLLPDGSKRAETISFRAGGAGVAFAERLARLGLSTAVLAGPLAGAEAPGAANARELLDALRKRGVRTKKLPSASGIPWAIIVKTPHHELRIASPAAMSLPSEEAFARALRGSRHFHVSVPVGSDRRTREAARRGLRQARRLGLTTSLELKGIPAPETSASSLLRDVDVVFSEARTLRALADLSRLGAAAESILELGVRTIAVQLGAGGSRVYARGDTRRVPAFGDVRTSEEGAFASGFVLGWLLGAGSAVCGLLGGALALPPRGRRAPDRRELFSRLAKARTDPRFRALVSDIQKAQRLLAKPRRLPPRRREPSRASRRMRRRPPS